MKMGCGSGPLPRSISTVKSVAATRSIRSPTRRIASRTYQRRCRNAKSVRRGPHSGSADKIVARSMRVRLREQHARADLLRGSHSLRKPPLLRRSTPEIRDLSSILRCRERGAGGVLFGCCQAMLDVDGEHATGPQRLACDQIPVHSNVGAHARRPEAIFFQHDRAEANGGARISDSA